MSAREKSGPASPGPRSVDSSIHLSSFAKLLVASLPIGEPRPSSTAARLYSDWRCSGALASWASRCSFDRLASGARVAGGEGMHDDGGFDDDVAVMDEGRHHAVRVELEIGGVELIAVQGHQVAFPFQPLFRQSQPRLLGADRCSPMIEFDHRFLLVSRELPDV